jgi:hypothetical protein
MQEAAKNLLLVLVALFAIVGPLGGSPFFLALTREYSREARKALSWRMAMNSFFLLIGSYSVGTYILAFSGISLLGGTSRRRPARHRYRMEALCSAARITWLGRVTYAASSRLEPSSKAAR